MGTRSVTVRLDEGLVDWADARAAERGVKRTQVLEAGLRLLRGENLAVVEAGLEEASREPQRTPVTTGTGTSGENPEARGVRGASRKSASASPRAPVPDVPGVVRGSEVKRGYRDPMAGRPLRSSFSDHDQWLLALQRWRKASDAS